MVVRKARGEVFLQVDININVESWGKLRYHFFRSFQYFEINIGVYCLFFRYVKSLKSPVFNFFQQGVSSKSTVYAVLVKFRNQAKKNKIKAKRP